MIQNIKKSTSDKHVTQQSHAEPPAKIERNIKQNNIEKPSILHLITNVNIGGAERTLLRTIRYFDRNKFNHLIVTLLPPGNLFPQFKKTGINIRCLHMKNYFDVYALFKYINILKEKKPEIVVAYLFHALTFAVIGKILYPKAILVHYKRSITFATRPRDILGKLYKFFVNYLIGISHGVIASESETRFHLRLNSYVVYNGIELPQVPLRKKTSNKKTIIIGTITRLSKVKGLPYLLESAHELKIKKYRVKFVIVGGGELFTKLMKMVDEMGLKDTVELKGESMNVERYLKIFDIFVLPSLYEGFGNVFIEAMSYMVPVIGTNVSGINEIIKDNVNGLLIKPKSAKEITHAIIRLIKDPALREKLGREGRKTVERHFTIQQTVKGLESIFSQIVTKQRNIELRKGQWVRKI